jgi:hypothetical protein
VRLLLLLAGAGALGLLGCGGSRLRPDADVTVDPEPTPDPPAGMDPASPAPAPAPSPDAAAPADPDAASPDPGPPAGPGDPDPAAPDAAPDDPDGPASAPPDPPPPDPGPAAGTCGGVTCPELFDLVGNCRPMGMCTLNPAPLMLCYTNGIKIVPESLLPSNLVGLVKRSDGTDCYRARVSQTPGSTARNVIWETPAGVPIASGVFDSGGTGTITCQGATTPLTDPTCVAIPNAAGCMPGLCL